MDIQNEISERIKASFADAKVLLADRLSGDHWQATIISTAFEGMSRLLRQRSVYAALATGYRSNPCADFPNAYT